ncbi:hypothetical protein K470DRAFT_177391 [Piedraia hortae CBS 480.64]|uniref:Lytic polysaccharide monooxygenase n=1 Tax=Piedraia hortae CBS 480.64 TaxID=1314780 RepID=A0A6A7BQ66_9PEZI|nr:hypothetical protein K470DRAFT_177391 [Piedraia hortae CBS 480.64]
MISFIKAALTIAVMSLSIITTAMPLSAPPGVSSGGVPGHFWHVEPFTIQWPDRSIEIIANISETMPGWDSQWVPPGHQHSRNIEAREGGSGVTAHVFNQCSYPIYAHASIGDSCNVRVPPADDPDGLGTYMIQPGQSWTSNIRAAINGKGGVSIKLGKYKSMDPNNIYQIEFAQVANNVGEMALWYDLSSEFAVDPFLDEARLLQVGSPAASCATLYNAPGSSLDDWAHRSSVSCLTLQDFYFYLC